MNVVERTKVSVKYLGYSRLRNDTEGDKKRVQELKSIYEKLGVQLVEYDQHADIIFYGLCGCCHGAYVEGFGKLWKELGYRNHSRSVILLYSTSLNSKEFEWIGGLDLMLDPTPEQLLEKGVALLKKSFAQSEENISLEQ